jgi:hypothetical protein
VRPALDKTAATSLGFSDHAAKRARVIDPYADVNERIRRKRRAQGRRDDEYEVLIRAASHELGAATEAALGIFLDVAERIGLRYLEEAAALGATRRFRWAPEAVRAARFASSRLPPASGRVVSQSSEFTIRAAFSVLRELRQRLERTRRKPKPSAGRRRPRGAPPTTRPRRPSDAHEGSDPDRRGRRSPDRHEERPE